MSHSDTKVTIVATGPLTNIAMAMNKEPNIVQNIESITIMGGGTFGNWTPTAEFNIWVDAEAAKRVFESGVMINVFGLDVTHQVLATDEIISRFKGIDNEIARFVVELLEFSNPHIRHISIWMADPYMMLVQFYIYCNPNYLRCNTRESILSVRVI